MLVSTDHGVAQERASPYIDLGGRRASSSHLAMKASLTPHLDPVDSSLVSAYLIHERLQQSVCQDLHQCAQPLPFFKPYTLWPSFLIMDLDFIV